MRPEEAKQVCECQYLGIEIEGMTPGTHPNVVGVGLGHKSVRGQATEDLAVKFYVKQKLHPLLVQDGQRIPDEVEGVPTDVEESGEFSIWRPIPPIYHRKVRPAMGGLSIGHYQITAGTLGCLVKDARETFILSNNHVLCVDEKTEILTQDGWKDWTQVSTRDKLATRGKAGELEYHHPIAIYRSWYQGELIHFKSRFIDLLVTPDHRLYARRSYRTGPKDLSRRSKPLRNDLYGFVRAKDAQDRMTQNRWVTYLMTSFCKWNCATPEALLLPRVEYLKGKDHNVTAPISIKLWARFLGWYLSEGSCATNPSGNRMVSVRNTNPEYCAEIQSILREMGFNAFISRSGKGYAVVVNSKQLYECVRGFGKSADKYIPVELKNCAPDILAAFLDTYLKGDGWKAKKYMGALSKSKRLVDDLQEVFLKLGYHSSVRKTGGGYRPEQTYYVLTAYRLKETRVANVRTVPYRGWVYCATVPNGTLLVRRNGKPIWTGNSNENRGVEGDPILQPGRFDGGKTDKDVLARLDTFVALDPEEANLVDCALAQPYNPDDVTPDILNIGRLRGSRDASLEEKAMKSGRTTRVTNGTVTDVNATLRVGYSSGSLIFQDQMIIRGDKGSFSAGGDSGSVIVSYDGHALGLLFAGSPFFTVANKMTNVEKALDVKVV